MQKAYINAKIYPIANVMIVFYNLTSSGINKHFSQYVILANHRTERKYHADNPGDNQNNDVALLKEIEPVYNNLTSS